MDSAAPVAAPGVAYESEVAAHLARHALYIAPLVVLIGGAGWGVDGAISAAIGLVLVAANFLVSARLIAWASEHSPGMVQAVVLGGFVVRLAALTGIVLLLDLVPWVDVVPLVLTVAIAHLALLLWETRSVSLTLAAPGLKPGHGDRSREKESE